MIIGTDKTQVFIFERSLWDRAWKQACADYMSAQNCDDDRETADYHIRAATAIVEHAINIFDTMVTPPEGKAQ